MAGILAPSINAKGVLGQGKGVLGRGLKPDLSTPEGLQSFAEQKGFGTKLGKRLPKGENPKQIFSGGFISDIFDVLNIPQSIVAGVFQNKGVIDSIQTKASFSDPELMGRYGKKGVIAGILADIATDPLMLIPPLGIGKRILMALKGGEKFIRNTKIGNEALDLLGKKFVYQYGTPDAYKILSDDMASALARGAERTKQLVKPIAELTPAEQKSLLTIKKMEGDKIRIIREAAEKISPSILGKAKPAFEELDRLGQEAVSLGLLSKEIYLENVGKYIRNVFTKFDTPIGKKFFDSKPLRVDLSMFKKAKGVTPEVGEALGLVFEAGYPTARSLLGLSQAIAKTKFFNEVATRWGVAAEKATEGMKQLPTVIGLGKLSGKFVPKFIYDDIQEVIRSKGEWEQLLGKVVTGFKYGKVIMNPATHARNMMSGYILANFAGIPLARMPDLTAKAIKSIKTADKYSQELEKMGRGLDTFVGGELREIFVHSTDPAFKRIPIQILKKMADIYQGEERFGKRLVYIWAREKKIEPQAAWAMAEEALFNYSKVTPFVKRIRESIFGVPFITFTVKATPFVAKTFITKPATIGKYGLIKRDFEKLSPQDQLSEERKSEPDYIRNGYFVRLPVEDQHGRSLYFDMTYILPFGDLIAGTLFQASRPGERLGERMLSELPLFNILGELYSNKNFFGEEIIKANHTDPLEIGTDILSYLTKAYGPPPFTDTPGRIKTALSLGKIPKDEINQKRTLSEEILRNFGLKVQPYDLEQQKRGRKFESIEAASSFLKAEGLVKDFTRVYIPKNSF